MIKGVVAAVVAGVLGAAIWAAVSHFTGYELGIIAWGIGAAVGIGMLMGAGEQASGVTGGVAAVIAIAAVLGGKYATVHLDLEEALAENGGGWTLTEHSMLVRHADEVVSEWEDEGRTIKWPAGMTVEEAYEEADYPPEVWAEARSRWDRLSPGEQQAALAAEQARADEAVAMFKSDIREEGFLRSFTLFDILWIGLAVFTALKLGAGGGD